MSILTKIFGDANERVIKNLKNTVLLANKLETKIKLFKIDDFKEKTFFYKKKLADKSFAEQQIILDEILPEVFALVREAAHRTLGQRHYDVQLLAGMVLHQGNIAEMRTGEGKTLAATVAVYLNALTGRGVHVITVNDYLSRRDAVWMGQVYNYLGLSTGCLNHETAFLYDSTYHELGNMDNERDTTGSFKVLDKFLRPVPRQEAYLADITYGTNNEFGFDYLRDNMVQGLNEKVQRELHYAVVDEVDSILIDEARTPLIISAPDMESTDKYRQFAELVERLRESEDYNIDEKMKASTLTEAGIAKMEKWLNVENIYTDRGVRDVHHIEQALRAKVLFKKDRDYVIKDGEILIVDEFTGRLMIGRRYSDGLHQAIEAKENVAVKQESVTMATITFQNYFRMYQKLAGMTGTAATEAEELSKIYNLDVVVIPTNKPMIRIDKSDAIFKNVNGKYQRLVKEIKKRHKVGQPVLVGTISIENNEYLSELLKREGVPHELLNAKNHEREAEIIAQAGRVGAVTIATNMAGRGVDIILGGNPVNKEDQEKVKALGGLCVLGTERHESRRIDNQLRGRAGRQGDSGETHFFVSMEDDLMRIFGGDKMKSILQALGLEDDKPIENKMISNSIEKAQMKVEGHNFDIRKHLVEYDDVINKHREVIYKKRNEVLAANSTGQAMQDDILKFLQEELETVVNFHTQNEDESLWNLDEIYEVVDTIFPVPLSVRIKIEDIKDTAGDIKQDSLAKEKLINYLFNLGKIAYQELEEKINSDEKIKAQLKEGLEPMRAVERAMLLRSIDTLWVEHIDSMDHMREGIGLTGYGQKDPLVEYKKEAHRMFSELLANIRKQIVYTIFKIGLVNTANQTTSQTNPNLIIKNQSESTYIGAEKDKSTYNKEKIGRNDFCPCGSGLKFKKCHGK
ncbi:MAG TPA: preprotein translocase subunit SecA [bacterium]|nr:preprotein translocase subunit SecA [bacterium]